MMATVSAIRALLAADETSLARMRSVMTAPTRISPNTCSVADDDERPQHREEDEEAARPEDVADHGPIVPDASEVETGRSGSLHPAHGGWALDSARA